MRIEWIWLLPMGTLLLVGFDYGGVARLMWDMQPAARHIERLGRLGPVCLRVLAAILALAATASHLVRPAGG
ncbi:hypothetical protein [Streptomyces echinatus]|uniref:Uncharacterized protein n=1 Tax=Streptomyces echinatus TaxID=67293 RepID=A0A7W9Q420_9ACTN|nr:hypothetical protein [Streptomyces echinatus]MBB5932412.1 hypothetical protein [Streptomyces echinatus]